MSEEIEKEPQDLGELFTELKGLKARFGASMKETQGNPEQQAAAIAAFLENDLMSWMVDFSDSLLVGLEEMQDLVDPVKLSGGAAQNLVDVLTAVKQSGGCPPALLEKVEEGLADLTGDDDEEEDEEEEG